MCHVEMAKAFGNKSAVESFENVSLSRHTISTRVTKINNYRRKVENIIRKLSIFFALFG